MTTPSAPSMPEPLAAPVATEPDADYDGLRARAIQTVTDLAGSTWTDQNDTDPGITLLEAMAWGLADAHYRVSSRSLDRWPLATILGVPSPQIGDPTEVSEITDLLSHSERGGQPIAWRLTRQVEGARTRSEARRLVVDTAEQLAAERNVAMTTHPSAIEWCVDLLRRNLNRRAALDLSPTIQTSIAAATAAAAPDTPADDVDFAAKQLIASLPDFAHLWPDEIAALVAGERRRRQMRAVSTLARSLRSASDLELEVLENQLTAVGVPMHVAKTARALCSRPATLSPETWESTDGATEVWPPTADQTLRCEPVTAQDYASRARAVDGVGRAWAVAGALPGIAWHGGRTIVTDRKGTVTLLVERVPMINDPGTRESEVQYLRRVVQEVLSDETGQPWDTPGGRRGLGDEIGAALVRHCPITLSATLHCPAGAVPESVSEAAVERVRAYLRAGRSHSAPTDGSLGRGPWPDRPQPATGWQPGEPIPVSELTAVLADDAAVLGVTGLSVAVKDGPSVHGSVRVRSQSAVTPSGTVTVDGLALAAGDRVLLTAQADAAENGVYVVTSAAWLAADDFPAADDYVGAIVHVEEGTVANTYWEQTNDVAEGAAPVPLNWERSRVRVLAPVRVAVTTHVSPVGQQRLSGIRLFNNNRVLLTSQENPRDNGIYAVKAGDWERRVLPVTADRAGPAVGVREGDEAGCTWSLVTRPPITLGTTELTWHRTGAAQPAGGGATGQVEIPRGAVPILARSNCVQVRISTSSDTGDA